MKIFVDAGPLRALVTPSDQWFMQTITILQKITLQNPQFFTTDYIISEVFTGLQGIKGSGYKRILKLNTTIFKENFAQMEWITRERFLRTKVLILKVAKDKSWSFTDCTSFIVMKELKIKTVFTFDEHFEQMGFILLS